MIKIIDVDKLFDKYIEKYVYDNIGKVKPEEIENKIPVLYEKFGNAELNELDGKTPNEFYKAYNVSELLDCLKAHVENGVSVSDFLCEAIIASKNASERLIAELSGENLNEEYTAYVMNFLNDLNAEVPVQKYLDFCLWDYPESVGELATEFLCKQAERAKEDVIDIFGEAPENRKGRLVEILSNTKKDDRVFDILIAEFAKHSEAIPVYAGYLAKFGDERALPFLITVIEDEKISYADFEELRFAIEALGGTYDKVRDFSADKTYKKIKGVKRNLKK